jgi:hypothetical protein
MTGPLPNPLWAEELARDREHQLRSAELRRAARTPAAASPPEPVTLRLETVHDAGAIARLLTLAGRRRRTWGRHVVAEVDGEIVAALPLSGGDVFADPFRRTAHLVPLLQLRARQVTDPPPERRRRGILRLLSDSRLP